MCPFVMKLYHEEKLWGSYFIQQTVLPALPVDSALLRTQSDRPEDLVEKNDWDELNDLFITWS